MHRHLAPCTRRLWQVLQVLVLVLLVLVLVILVRVLVLVLVLLLLVGCGRCLKVEIQEVWWWKLL